MQIDANYTRAQLGFYGPTAMEGAAWFALFSTVFLASQGRGQGKVYFSFQINGYSLTPRLQIYEEFFRACMIFCFPHAHAIECH